MYRYDRYADKVLAWGETALGAPNDISHVTPQYHVFRRLQKNSVFFNFTPYFHDSKKITP